MIVTHPTIIWHISYKTVHNGNRHKKRVQAPSYGVPGYKPRNIWTPSACKKNAHTHCWVQTSSIFIRGLAFRFLTHVYTPQPTIIDVVSIQILSFLGLFLEHHNDSLMLLLVNMFRAARDGILSAIHRYIAAKLQIKIERTKKKGEKLKSCSLDKHLFH